MNPGIIETIRSGWSFIVFGLSLVATFFLLLVLVLFVVKHRGERWWV